MIESNSGAGQKKQRLPILLGLVVVGMFAFGFALVPLYNLVCSVAGINGIASSGGRISESELAGLVDTGRTIMVDFDANVHANLDWEFRPMVKRMEVHPGKVYQVAYYAQNNSAEAVVGQAIPGVTPWQATAHFNKTECFCFAQQSLQPGEGKEMPLRFVISPDLPAEYEAITLSYVFMDSGRYKEQTSPVPGQPAAVAVN